MRKMSNAPFKRGMNGMKLNCKILTFEDENSTRILNKSRRTSINVLYNYEDFIKFLYNVAHSFIIYSNMTFVKSEALNV
jgi:hypothetical protein